MSARPAVSPALGGSAPVAGSPSLDPRAAVMPTYARRDVVFASGDGCWLTSTAGERYLDFAAGIAVNALGHAHPRLVQALTEQAGRLWHTSNLYRVAGQERLAARLCEATFADRVFFCNSGAEACEGAIKIARRYHFANGAPERTRIITFAGAFHGRTLTMLAAGGNAQYLEGFGPPAPGFDCIPFGDHAALEAAIGPETAAILIEPIQGEGGVRVVPPQCLRGLREVCDRHGLLLILDEVQTGMGRTGRLFAYEHAGITPDIMAVAKGLGGGFPVGAVLATAVAGAPMTAGSHGSTFGGNPLAMAVGNAVLDVMLEPGFLAAVEQRALRLKQGLAGLQATYPELIAEVRGQGLLAGLQLTVPVAGAVGAAFQRHLLVAGASDTVMRLVPPLTVSDAEIGEAVQRLAQALEDIQMAGKAVQKSSKSTT